eukprot:TRINITY_DN2490_c0_g1_i4.p1 TRINITY_DN2490_c0_g1~~TRINITY_DN2490_c0_g1_i4.p1  ORF type:complete len:747 (-),score=241.98 TRINITY_DN2490_c0_g1_i4:1943-4183(-)
MSGVAVDEAELKKDVSTQSISQLKAMLKAHNVRFDDCVEKADLINRVLESKAYLPTPEEQPQAKQEENKQQQQQQAEQQSNEIEIEIPKAKVLIDVPEAKSPRDDSQPPPLEAVTSETAPESKQEAEEEEEEEEEPTVPAEEASAIVEALKSAADDEVKAAQAEKIGDLCRIEGNRAIFGNAGAIEAAVDILVNNPTPHLRRLALRAIGNSIYENKENRDRTVNAHNGRIFELLRNSLDSALPSDVKKTTAGVITNLAFDSPDYQVKLAHAGCTKGLVQLIREYVTSDGKVKDNMLVSMALKALCNLAANYSQSEEGDKSSTSSPADINMAKLVGSEEGITKLLVALLESDDATARTDALAALVAIAAHPENYEQVIAEGGLQSLFTVIKQDREDELRKGASEFLEKLADNEKIRNHFAPLLDTLIDYVQNAPRGEKAQVKVWANVLKALGHLSASDDFIDKLFPRRALFMSFGEVEDPEAKLGVGMLLGNLARRDDNCRTLMNEGIIPFANKFLQVPDSRVVHLGLGIIRNLSILQENRIKIAEADNVIQLLGKVLESRNAHVLFLNMGVIRTLVLSSVKCAEGFIASGALEHLMVFFSQEIPDEHKRIQFEAGRVVAALVYKLPNPDPVINNDGIKALRILIQSTYQLLQQEGMRALHSLAKYNAKHRKPVAEGEGVAAILNLLTSTDAETKLLSIDTIRQLIQETEVRESFVSAGAREKVEKAIENEKDAQTLNIANALIAQL